MDERTEINCACLIHGDYYSWQYVDNLYAMLRRNLPCTVNLHVFTEISREVPAPYIKHPLPNWPEITSSKQAWWYKLQLFDPSWINTPVLYFDLDVVITSDLGWILALNPSYLWAAQDFQRIWKPSWRGINSSILWFTPNLIAGVWDTFKNVQLSAIMQQYHGDQDFISAVIDQQQIKFIDPARVSSWRWEILHGGINPGTMQYRDLNNTVIPDQTSVIVCHGNPKPHVIDNSIVQAYWCGNK
jgi:hypothetical protein